MVMNASQSESTRDRRLFRFGLVVSELSLISLELFDANSMLQLVLPVILMHFIIAIDESPC